MLIHLRGCSSIRAETVRSSSTRVEQSLGVDLNDCRVGIQGYRHTFVVVLFTICLQKLAWMRGLILMTFSQNQELEAFGVISHKDDEGIYFEDRN